MSEPLVLIDLSSIARPTYEVHTNDADPNSVSTQIVARVRALASGKPSGVAVACDSGRSFRHEISADYKATRGETPATYLHQVGLAQEILRGDGFPVWSAAGFEADDIIATAVAKDMDYESAMIVSGDKDFHCLVNERVTVFRPAVGNNEAVTYDVAKVREKHGVDPNQMFDYLCLLGDKSDNVLGAKGIGEKTAASLLQKFGNIDDLYAAMDRGEVVAPPKGTESLQEFRGRLETVRSLIRMRTDAPIPFEEIFRERVPADVAVFGDETMEQDDIEFAMPTWQEPAKEAAKPQPEQPAVEPKTIDALLSTTQTTHVATPAKPAAAQTQALEVRQSEPLAPPPDDWKLQLEPRSMTQAVQLADRFFASRLLSAFGYGAPQAVLLTIMAGRELGFQATAALRAFHIIDSKPTLAASAIRALVIKSGVAEYFRCSERTAERATFVTKRKGSPEQSLTFTIEEARQSWSKGDDAWKKSGYGRNPADQLVARASSKLANLEYPDVLLGLYSTEEMQDGAL